MPRVPAAVRSLVPHRLALIAVVVTATLSATLLAALVSFAALVTGYAVRATLRSNPATGILVTAPATSAATAAGEFGQVRATVDRGLPGGPLTVAGSLSTDFLPGYGLAQGRQCTPRADVWEVTQACHECLPPSAAWRRTGWR